MAVSLKRSNEVSQVVLYKYSVYRLLGIKIRFYGPYECLLFGCQAKHQRRLSRFKEHNFLILKELFCSDRKIILFNSFRRTLLF